MDPSPRLDRIRRALRQLLGLRTLRAHVVVLVIACILPMVGFSAFAVLRYAHAQRESYDRQILNTARALSAAMDAELKTAEAALAALATSPALRDRDFVQLYAQSQQIASRHHAWVALAEPTGRVIFTTRRAIEDSPRHLRSDHLAVLAATTRTVQISNLFYGTMPDRLQISIYLPVVEQDAVNQVLLMSFDSRELSRALLDERLPESWRISVIDGNNRVIARSRDVERLAGQPADASLIERIAAASEGVYPRTTWEDVPVSTAFTRSTYTGWTLAISVPLAETAASLQTSLREIGIAAAAMLILGLLFAGAVGGRMAEILRGLSSAALALGHGAPVPSTRRNIAEVDAVLGALDTAGALLHQRSRQRDEAEQALRRSEQRFRDIAETAADWIWESDGAHSFTYFTGAESISAGSEAAQVVGTTRWQYAGGDVERDDHWKEHKADLDAHRPIRGFRYSLPGDGGRRVHYLVNGNPVFAESGAFAGYRGTATNETEVVEARQRAEQADALLQDAVDSISEGFVIYDRDDRLVMFNERYRALFSSSLARLGRGATFEEIVRDGIVDQQYPEAAGREEDWLAERLRRHRETVGSIEQRLTDGRWLLITERRMRNGGIAGLRIDITALKEAQARLAESKARLDHAQRIAHIGSWELDLASGEFVWSKEMYDIRGLSPDTYNPTTSNLDRYIHPDDYQRAAVWVWEWRAGGRPSTLEFRVQRPDGAVRFVSAEGEPITDACGKLVKITGTMQDITEKREAETQRRALEDQLHHSQKLEALGMLAGGIAHDLNNTLVPVISMAKLGMKHSETQSALRQKFELIHQAGQRARDLVKQVLAFSRKDTADRQRFRVHEVVNEALAMLRPTVPATIAIERDISPVPPILGDPTQIHQVVVNLMTNAMHAIGIELGTITVSVSALPGAKRGAPNFIRLSVRDTGGGMDEATQKRIFDPFFTTKPVGEGTGLGLSVVHGIVANHGGTIRVESRPGHGTRFIIDLPLAEAPAEPKQEAAAA